MTLPEKTPAQALAIDKRSIGQGLFKKCARCGSLHTAVELADQWEVCPDCGYHHQLAVADWRKLLLDEGALELWEEQIAPTDPLGFEDGEPYSHRLKRAQSKTGASEAIEIGRAHLGGRCIAWGCYNFAFLGGSMGSVVGERVTRLFERARAACLPIVLLHASGGARMQEGILSLMQMAKTCAALGRFRDAGIPYLSVLLHPTTGGVAASTALLGDVNLAEPNALIGFAGPRVIENTLRTKLPQGFQRAEFLLSHGMVDMVVPRTEMKAMLALLLTHLGSVSP